MNREEALSRSMKRITAYTSICFCLIISCLNTLARRRGITLIDASFIYTSIPGALFGIIAIAITGLVIGNLSYRASISESRLSGRLLLIAVIIAVLTTVKTGGIYDYPSYEAQWSVIASGGNAWGDIQGAAKNAYGPVHNSFAIVYAMVDKGPKAVWSLAAITLFIVYSRRYRQYQALNTLAMFGPFTFISIYVYGFMDTVPAVTMCCALLFAKSDKYYLAGIALSISTLSKFYAFLLLPVLTVYAVKKGGIRKGLVLATVYSAMILLVGIASYLKWGSEVFNPLMYASERSASFLSLWRVAGNAVGQDMPKVIMACAYLAMVVYAVRFKDIAKGLSISLCGILCMIFGLYHIGHHQFYLSIIMMVPLVAEEIRYNCRDVDEPRKTAVWGAIGIGVIVGWLTALQLFFVMYDELKPLQVGVITDSLSVINSSLLVAAGLVFIGSIPSRSGGFKKLG